MALDLKDCTFFGPALPEPFVKFELENLLNKDKLLPSNVGGESKLLQNEWDNYRRKLRALSEQGGSIRVINHVFEPLVKLLGYDAIEKAEPVTTREDSKNGEDGGYLITTSDKSNKLRVWAVEVGIDLDAPNKRGRAYRFSPSRIAQRVLLAKSERVGLLTDGQELRLLICDPARPDSHIVIRLDRGEGGWRSARDFPDSFRLLLALASPKGIAKVPDLTEKARLSQTEVTKTLRLQAQKAVEGFVQGILDHPKNREKLTLSEEYKDKSLLAKQLWSEGLIFIYRLLFIFKLESSADPARAFSFASTSLWRNTYSPNTALAKYAREVIDNGGETGQMLEAGLRVLFRLFAEGLSVNELNIKPLGGMLFDSTATKLIDGLSWGEHAVATLLDKLLWTPKGKVERQRVHYGSLDVEDLGRVYEALLELEPGIATEPMCRLRRQKLEVVVPIAQGERYRTTDSTKNEVNSAIDDEDLDNEDNEEDNTEETSSSSKKTKVEWIEAVSADHFYLRVGLGRKASGSYYTPHAFVRFLVQETLGIQVAERSPATDPKPMEILKLKALDPAMGSGHFLVEACRFLGEKLYEACRLCDELASQAEEKAKKATSETEREEFENLAIELINRVKDLPDPNDELLAYLPSRVVEGEESGLSQWKALALCRRLIAVHCLYGVDKNPLAVELAKLSLWLESYAEGLPLTFLDHRLVCGDSLTGPFFEHLLTYPGSGKPLEGLFVNGLDKRLTDTLNEALTEIQELEASIGKDIPDIKRKCSAKIRLDKALEPFKLLAAAWSGGAMLGKEYCDDTAYGMLLKAVAEKADAQVVVDEDRNLSRMVTVGIEGVAYDLVFPEVFYFDGKVNERKGFNAVIGNPPWDRVRPLRKEFLANYDVNILDTINLSEGSVLEETLMQQESIKNSYQKYVNNFEAASNIYSRIWIKHNQIINNTLMGRGNGDSYIYFTELCSSIINKIGYFGLVLPAGIHANEGSTGLRRVLLKENNWLKCFSFKNTKKIFEIGQGNRFDLIVATKQGEISSLLEAIFGLEEVTWLFSIERVPEVMKYSHNFIEKTGGEYLSLIELPSFKDADVISTVFINSQPWPELYRGISFGVEADMTRHSNKFLRTAVTLPPDQDPRKSPFCEEIRKEKQLIPLHEKGTITKFKDLEQNQPRFLAKLDEILGQKTWLPQVVRYRICLRMKIHAAEEHKLVGAFLPPGCLTVNNALTEKTSWNRPNALSLILLSIFNSLVFDFITRVFVVLTLNVFILERLPTPYIFQQRLFLLHSALRLVCNHSGYAFLWYEQMGNVWREDKLQFSWPVLATDDECWSVRAKIDAVVANAYGLSRDQYEHVLSTFSHKSYPKASELCLAAFDELKAIGLDEFTKKHDPYWDIPLNEELPKPVIELPQISMEETTTDGNDNTKKKKKSKNTQQPSLF